MSEKGNNIPLSENRMLTQQIHIYNSPIWNNFPSLFFPFHFSTVDVFIISPSIFFSLPYTQIHTHKHTHKNTHTKTQTHYSHFSQDSITSTHLWIFLSFHSWLLIESQLSETPSVRVRSLLLCP